jgi:hypothetical protein
MVDRGPPSGHLAAINARRKNGGTLLDVALRRDRDFAEALRCCGAETRKSKETREP